MTIEQGQILIDSIMLLSGLCLALIVACTWRG